MASKPTKTSVVLWIDGDEAFGGKLASPAGATISSGGVTAASIDDRSGPEVTLAIQLADAKAPVRRLRADAPNTISIQPYRRDGHRLGRTATRHAESRTGSGGNARHVLMAEQAAETTRSCAIKRRHDPHLRPWHAR